MDPCQFVYGVALDDPNVSSECCICYHMLAVHSMF